MSIGALYGMYKSGHGTGLEKAVEIENRMYESKIESGEIEPNEHKRAVHETEASTEPTRMPNRRSKVAKKDGEFERHLDS